ncbi:class III poly(R)-hydroxyalkanoic acid synthase subunit PhaE [Lysobacter sp. CFH 32150]|uniref:class III poly(R)-hydroxyalkanoic acid synthase subunit PhaE n=1 Tax=Lysobacter sp. CFH 32150 TaxID=2927128 RepID=UPI001FA6EC8A|nr:class III poly(R)-hydroxyalkanoic acid synthase subunit PhaE [Lysobacter sp. CFH 32150]MCI4567225.1 class III poly(R)-hydroxyalkanoic acid synthase subunit PhaE [Lysobacter sp. CFH 32150]
MASTARGAGFNSTDFEALARQYWNAWGETMRGGGNAGSEPMHAGAKAWHEAIDWWTQLVHGNRTEVNAAVERFNTQARDWYGQMQQVAAQFAGQDASAAEITRAWKQALGAVGENPFPEMFRAMRGQGQQGLEQWIEDASPYLDAWKREGASWLGMPAFGLAREHQERWQALMQARLDYQEQTNAYNALMLKSAQRAYEVFESKLAERSEPGRQLQSARALFDLWIDAAEEAYAEIALSPEFRKVYGALVNAQMRVRAGVQKEVEQLSGSLGMPTRTEVDAAHRKIAELERQLRRLRDREVAPAAPTAAKPAAKKPAAKQAEPAAKKTARPAVKKSTKGKR